jgi:sterol desaturase/sphingolipid hydroxylase (fatty acid hydroxylase superfamily)
MDISTIAGLCLPVVFILFMGLEAFMPSGRAMPDVPHWRLIGLAGLIVTLLVNGLLPFLIIPWLPNMTIVDIGYWGLWAALPTLVLTTFLTYWTHRIQHRFDLLWRAGHQLHHGVARVDIASAMIFHPVDVTVQLMMTLVAAGILNISPEAGAVAGVSGFVIALYQHWNVRTPAWTGWFIQRPEAHLLHHERDVHARNFGDMPVWDRLFGTYAAPREEPVTIGFEQGRARRWLAMLAFVDVNRAEGRLRL